MEDLGNRDIPTFLGVYDEFMILINMGINMISVHYAISYAILGPAGLKPFTGKAQLKCS